MRSKKWKKEKNWPWGKGRNKKGLSFQVRREKRELGVWKERGGILLRGAEDTYKKGKGGRSTKKHYA